VARIRLLILGGTAESIEIAAAAGRDGRYEPILSLAGATRSPRLPAVRCRSGGFGGLSGLTSYIAAEGIDLIIAATHPFAAQIREHAVAAARISGRPLLILERPAWSAEPRDRWIAVADMVSAAQALGPTPRRVFLTIGRKELSAFVAQPQHWYLIRTIEAPLIEHVPPGAELLRARGPFTVEDERALLISRGIEVLVSKNSGGTATVAKLRAARECHLPVIMVERPPLPRLAGLDVHIAGSVSEALRHLGTHHERASDADRLV